MAALHHPLLEELDSSLASFVPKEPVAFSGSWTTSRRRTYERHAQDGSGSGPFVDVVDHRWRGAVSSAIPFAGVLLLLTPTELHWVKSGPAALTHPVDLSLTALADDSPERATFGARMGAAHTPAVPVSYGADLSRVVALGPLATTTGCVTGVARADGAAFFVLLLPGSAVETGRNRLWRLRDALTTRSLSPPVRDLLTRGRSGIRPLEPSK